MNKYRFLGSLLLALVLLGITVQPAMAFPPLPSSFYGTAKINGLNVPNGMVITAKINGVAYASAVVQIYQGNTVYSLDVPGDQSDTPAVEGGVEGDTIVFFIGATQASQTGIWHSGTNVSLNLTGSASFTYMYLPMVRR